MVSVKSAGAVAPLGEAVGKTVDVCLDVEPGLGVSLLCLLDMVICIDTGVSNRLLQFTLHLVSGRQHQWKSAKRAKNDIAAVK